MERYSTKIPLCAVRGMRAYSYYTNTRTLASQRVSTLLTDTPERIQLLLASVYLETEYSGSRVVRANLPLFYPC